MLRNTPQILKLTSSTGYLFLFCLVGVLGCGFYEDEYGNRKLMPAPPPSHWPYELAGEPYAIERGDELLLVNGDTATFCRLQGIRAPQINDRCFLESGMFLKSLVEGRQVNGVVLEHDSEMRAVFRGYVGDTDLNLEMVLSGFARYDGTEFRGSSAFLKAEAQARDARRGMWQEIE